MCRRFWPDAERVAQFVDGEYAVHRWTYGQGAVSALERHVRVTAEDRLNERLRQENLLLRWRNDVMTEYADLHAHRMHAAARDSSDGRGAIGGVPVIIISRDRLDCLRQLVDWLEHAPGIGTIHIVDNASTWPPLLDYLDQSPHTVHRLEVNLGHHAPWVIGLVASVSGAPFVVTDPDVLPDATCPPDVIAHFRASSTVTRRSTKRRSGSGSTTCRAAFHIATQSCGGRRSSGETRLEPGASGPRSTPTFALYRPGREHKTFNAPRTGAPYVARHLPWYVLRRCR